MSYANELRENRRQELVGSLFLQKFCVDALRLLGIQTILDLLEWSPRELAEHFGNIQLQKDGLERIREALKRRDIDWMKDDGWIPGEEIEKPQRGRVIGRFWF